MIEGREVGCSREPPTIPNPMGRDIKLDQGRQELLVMETLHIQMTPSEEHFVKTEDWKSLIAGLQWSGTQK